MSFQFGNKLSTSGLILSLDAGSPGSYIQNTSTAATWVDIGRYSINSRYSIGDVQFSSNFNGYFAFNGTGANSYTKSDYGDRNTTLDIGAASLTIEVFVRIKGSVTGAGVIYQYGFTAKDTPTSATSYGLAVQSDRLAIITSAAGIRTISGTGTKITPNQWQHLVAVYDQPNIRTFSYINGVAAGNDAGNITIAAGSNRLANYSVGAKTDGATTTNQIAADIAIVKVYNRAIADTEVLNNYLFYRNRFNV